MLGSLWTQKENTRKESSHFVPKSFWKSFENQKNFFEGIKIKFDIREPSDWKKVTLQDIRKSGGKTLLNYHSYAKWNNEYLVAVSNVPKSYWNSAENQRKFLDEIKNKFHIKEPRDWGKVTVRDIQSAGGISILERYYQRSLFKCLQTVYRGFFIYGTSHS